MSVVDLFRRRLGAIHGQDEIDGSIDRIELIVDWLSLKTLCYVGIIVVAKLKVLITELNGFKKLYTPKI